MFSVYVLYSELIGKYYVGQTSNIDIRLLSHNNGESKFTSKGIPWCLKLELKVDTRKEAIILERKLKNLSGVRLQNFITKYQ